jgi:hypothetical protein
MLDVYVRWQYCFLHFEFMYCVEMNSLNLKVLLWQEHPPGTYLLKAYSFCIKSTVATLVAKRALLTK